MSTIQDLISAVCERTEHIDVAEASTVIRALGDILLESDPVDQHRMLADLLENAKERKGDA